jgi:prevent-host-death family protein
MIQTVSVEELHNRIDELLAKVKDSGDELILSEHGTPVLRVRPAVRDSSAGQPRRPGSAKGEFVVPDDFDAPLPDDIVETFYQ